MQINDILIYLTRIALRKEVTMIRNNTIYNVTDYFVTKLDDLFVAKGFMITLNFVVGTVSGFKMQIHCQFLVILSLKTTSIWKDSV